MPSNRELLHLIDAAYPHTRDQLILRGRNILFHGPCFGPARVPKKRNIGRPFPPRIGPWRNICGNFGGFWTGGNRVYPAVDPKRAVIVVCVPSLIPRTLAGAAFRLRFRALAHFLNCTVVL